MSILMDCFGPGLVDELRGLYPSLDVSRIAGVVALRHSREPLKNPDSYLQAACRGEFDRGSGSASSPARTKAPPKEQHRGTFMPDGGWWDGADRESAAEHSLNSFILRCIYVQASPAWAADALQDEDDSVRGVLSGAGAIAFWPRLTKPDQWHAAPTQSGAQEWLKRRMLASLPPLSLEAQSPAPEAGAAPTQGAGVLGLLAGF